MLTQYNFGAALDREMLHKIYNAEPVALFIKIPGRALVSHQDSFKGLKNDFTKFLQTHVCSVKQDCQLT